MSSLCHRVPWALIAALGVAIPSLALAQGRLPNAPKKAPDADADADDKGEGGTEVELEEDPPPEDMEGTSENPDEPRLVEGDGRTPDDKVPAIKRTGYPIEEVLRPLTLPAVTSEVGLEVAAIPGGPDVEIGLRARYGITRQWQIGLRYGIGGLYDDPATMSDDAVGFNTGKAVGLDVTYLVFDWLAGRITVPVYVDPVAVAVTIGAPMKFRIRDGKLAIVVLDNFLDIAIERFVPSLTNELANEVSVENDDTNTVDPRGNLHLRGGVIYQHKPELAIKGEFVQTFEDFGDGDNATGLEGSVQYSPSPRFDVSGRIGFGRLDDAGDSFALTVAAAFRI